MSALRPVVWVNNPKKEDKWCLLVAYTLFAHRLVPQDWCPWPTWWTFSWQWRWWWPPPWSVPWYSPVKKKRKNAKMRGGEGKVKEVSKKRHTKIREQIKYKSKHRETKRYLCVEDCERWNVTLRKKWELYYWFILFFSNEYQNGRMHLVFCIVTVQIQRDYMIWWFNFLTIMMKMTGPAKPQIMPFWTLSQQ